MLTYKLANDKEDNAIGVIKIDDGIVTPIDPAKKECGRDWLDYQRWLSVAGNVPAPADEDTTLK